MNIASLIASFVTGTYTVTRTATPDTDNRGRALPGVETTFTITASVVPVSGNELLRIPEGRRENDTRALITATLLTVGTGTTYEADTVSIDSIDWEVSHVENWKDPISGATAYRCLIQDVS